MDSPECDDKDQTDDPTPPEGNETLQPSPSGEPEATLLPEPDPIDPEVTQGEEAPIDSDGATPVDPGWTPPPLEPTNVAPAPGMPDNTEVSDPDAAGQVPAQIAPEAAPAAEEAPAAEPMPAPVGEADAEIPSVEVGNDDVADMAFIAGSDAENSGSPDAQSILIAIAILATIVAMPVVAPFVRRFVG